MLPKIRLISLNMNYCTGNTDWIFINSTDPLGQLQLASFIYLFFLILVAFSRNKILIYVRLTIDPMASICEEHQEKVYTIGHYSSRMCMVSFSWAYYSIVNRYQNTITGQFFAHTHFDELTLSYNETDSKQSNNGLITSIELNVPESIIFNEEVIDEFITKEIQQGFPGAALIISRYGKILKQTVYGYKLKYDENAKIIQQPQLLILDTMFDLASLTKMYATNYALMHLVEQGMLNIDDPVKKHIPQYCGCNPDKECREARLIKDLLTHTAGYAPSVKFYDPEKVSSDLFSQDKHETEDIIETKLGFQRSRSGDQLPVYSDIDYMLLGLVVEHISGMSIDQYVKINIYQPLCLTHTLFNPLNNTNYQRSNFAATELNGNTRNHTINFPNVRTHVLQGEVHDEKSFYSMNGLSGHAGLFSNLNDMSILTQIMLNNGTYGNVKFWSKNVQDLFLKPYAYDPTYGLGWRLNRNKSLSWFGLYASNEAYGHTGWTGTCTVIDPQYSMAITLLTNKRHTPYINGTFDGEKYETGKYGKIMTLIYESMLLHKVPSRKLRASAMSD
ncbi:unnamed protein product [Rotaria sp. Silwood1]|nr:unnamed protein product [Rotaria sp. Silwood1]CAF1230153.1 unnamed protein product [Rotaria sp. Silwood1]CAF3471294.1 unnamed protein product [Rotaria sp. Silwood1]